MTTRVHIGSRLDLSYLSDDGESVEWFTCTVTQVLSVGKGWVFVRVTYDDTDEIVDEKLYDVDHEDMSSADAWRFLPDEHCELASGLSHLEDEVDRLRSRRTGLGFCGVSATILLNVAIGLVAAHAVCKGDFRVLLQQSQHVCGQAQQLVDGLYRYAAAKLGQ